MLRRIKSLLLFACILGCGTAYSAVIELSNGDRVSGEITGCDNQFVHVTTKLFGPLDIPLASVMAIRDTNTHPEALASSGKEPEGPSRNAAHAKEDSEGKNCHQNVADITVQDHSTQPNYFGFLIPASFYRSLDMLKAWESKVKLGLNVIDSETGYRSQNIALSSERKWNEKYEAKLSYEQDYATTTDSAGTETVSQDKLKMIGRFRHNYDTNLFFQSESQFGYARVSGIDRDFVQSFGCGWKVSKTRRISLDLVPSILIEKQKVDGEYQDLTPSPSFTEEMSIKFSDGFLIRNTASASFPIDNGNDPSWQFMLSLENKLTRNLFTSLEYLIEYDGAVSETTEPLSNSLKASLGLNF